MMYMPSVQNNDLLRSILIGIRGEYRSEFCNASFNPLTVNEYLLVLFGSYGTENVAAQIVLILQTYNISCGHFDIFPVDRKRT